MSAPRGSSSRIQKRKAGRPRPLPPEVNARNLAIEKQRRGALNDKFLALARLIPGLDTTQRLTKVLIVDESIRALEEQRALYMAAVQDKQDLMAENERLNMEVTTLRSQILGCCACSANMGISADPRLQLMNLYTGAGNDWLREAGTTYNSTPNANGNLIGTSAQSSMCPDVAEQPLQPCVQDFRLRGVFDMQY